MFGKKPEGVEKKKAKRSGVPAIVWMFVGSLLTLMIGVFLYLWQPFKSPTSDQKDPVDGMQVNNDDLPSQSQTGSSSSGQSNEQTSQSQSGKSTQTSQPGQPDYEFYELLPEQEVTPIPDTSITGNDSSNTSDKKPADVTLTLPTEEFDDDVTYSPDDTYDGGPAVGTTTSDHKTDTNVPTEGKTNDPIEDIISAAKNATKDAVKQGKQTSYILQINSYNTAEEADKRRAEILLAGVDAQVVRNTASGETLYQVISESYDNKTAVFMAQQRLQSSGIDSFVVERKN